jgi:hypothetical protein
MNKPDQQHRLVVAERDGAESWEGGMTKTTGPAPYTYPAERCDVLDKANLGRFREKRAQWIELLEKDKLHSVGTQLSALVWQDAVFRLLNEAWRLNDPANPTASMASLLVEALTNGYVTGLVLGVSRLTDPRKQTKKGDQDVVSLRRVFDDIRANRDIITREVFVCYDGLVYDIGDIPPPSARGGRSGAFTSVSIGGPLDDVTPTLLHEHFDKLSGVSPDKRRREDLIGESEFDEITALMTIPVIEKLRTLRNKIVAHAADPASRDSLTSFGFSLAEAEEALKALTQAQQRVQLNLLWNTDSGVMPIPQFDIMEHMDQPFLRPEQLEALAPFWARIAKEREDWTAKEQSG